MNNLLSKNEFLKGVEEYFRHEKRDAMNKLDLIGGYFL